MSAERTIFLFKNDIMITIRDTAQKMAIVHPNDDAAVRAEIEHRLMTVWKITLADLGM